MIDNEDEGLNALIIILPDCGCAAGGGGCHLPCRHLQEGRCQRCREGHREGRPDADGDREPPRPQDHGGWLVFWIVIVVGLVLVVIVAYDLLPPMSRRQSLSLMASTYHGRFPKRDPAWRSSGDMFGLIFLFLCVFSFLSLSVAALRPCLNRERRLQFLRPFSFAMKTWRTSAWVTGGDDPKQDG